MSANWKPSTRRTLVVGAVVLLVGLVLPLVVSLTQVAGVALGTPVQLFGYLLGNNPVISFAAALLPALVICPQVSEELSRRFISVTRVRESIRGRLGRMLAWNAAAGGAVMFVIPLVTAMVAFYVAPQLGWVQLDPSVYNLGSPQEILVSETSQFAFSQLVVNGHWLYGLVYSAWVGFVGAGYATLVLSLMVMLPNRFVGMSLPWVGYIVLSFGLAVFGLPGLAPTVIVPFNLVQVPMWQPLLMSLVIGAAAAGAALVMLRRVTRWESLQ